MNTPLQPTRTDGFRNVLTETDNDEFAFGTPRTDAVFRSRRANTRRKTIRVLACPAYLPSYQLVAKIIGYTASYHKPGIGFSVSARGKIVLTREQSIVRPI